MSKKKLLSFVSTIKQVIMFRKYNFGHKGFEYLSTL